MKIYRLSDRVPLRVKGLTFWLAPLSYEQTKELRSLVKMTAGAEKLDPMVLASMSVRMSLKDVEGLENHDGTPYVLEFGPDGLMTQECFDEIVMGCEATPELMDVVSKLWNRGFAPDSMKDIEEGVVVDFSAVRSVKKNSSALTPVN